VYGEFSNRSDIIDSRDVIAKIDELKEYILNAVFNDHPDEEEIPCGEWDNLVHVDLIDGVAEDITAFGQTCDDADVGEELDELLPLLRLDAEGRDACSEWDHGEALIRDDYMPQYAEQLADDLGFIGQGVDTNRWPFDCLDWDKAADELKYDYTRVDFDGQDYWIRSY